jgi:hypothetical protein
MLKKAVLRRISSWKGHAAKCSTANSRAQITQRGDSQYNTHTVRVPCGDELGERPVPAGRPPACLPAWRPLAGALKRMPALVARAVRHTEEEMILCDAMRECAREINWVHYHYPSNQYRNCCLISIRRIAPINIAQSIHQ